MLGVVSVQAVKTICHAVINGDVEPALLLLKETYEKGLDLCELMDAIAERFRILSLAAHVHEAKTLLPTVDEEDVLLAKTYDKADLKRLFAMAIDGMTQVFQAQKPLFALELFVMRAALRPPLSEAVTINYCLQKLDALMHNRPLPEYTSQTLLPNPQAIAARPSSISHPKKDANSMKVSDLLQDFSKLIGGLNKLAPAIASHLRHARPFFNEDEQILTLFFEQSLHYEQIMASKDDHRLIEALQSMFGRKLELKIELKKTIKSPDSIKTVAEADEEHHKQKQAALYEKAHNNEIVKKALAIFGGDIAEIKRIDPA
jgi:DNA polymerase III gamma/tau subunit